MLVEELFKKPQTIFEVWTFTQGIVFPSFTTANLPNAAQRQHQLVFSDGQWLYSDGTSWRGFAGVETPNITESATISPVMGAANTWSAWTPLVLSTSRRSFQIGLSFTSGDYNATTIVELQLAHGSGDIPFFGDFSFLNKYEFTASGARVQNEIFPFEILSGDKISVRMRAPAGAGVVDPIVNIALMGREG